MFGAASGDKLICPPSSFYWLFQGGYAFGKVFVCSFTCDVCFMIVLMSSSYGASGGLCFVIVVFPEYLHLSFIILIFFINKHEHNKRTCNNLNNKNKSPF